MRHSAGSWRDLLELIINTCKWLVAIPIVCMVVSYPVRKRTTEPIDKAWA